MFTPNIEHIGKQSYSAPDLYIAKPKETVIGSFVSIGTGVRIGNGTHSLNYLTTSPYLYFWGIKRLKHLLIMNGKI